MSTEILPTHERDAHAVSRRRVIQGAAWVAPAIIVAASAPSAATGSFEPGDPVGQNLIVYSATVVNADGGNSERKLRVQIPGIQPKQGGVISSATVTIACDPASSVGLIDGPVQSQPGYAWNVLTQSPGLYVLTITGVSASYLQGFEIFISPPGSATDISAGTLVLSGTGVLDGVATAIDFTPVGTAGSFTYGPKA